MNFIDVIRELKEGKCYAIKRLACTFTVELYKSNGIPNGIDFGGGKIAFEHFFATDWILVDPIPQTEMVEVKRWAIIDDDGDFKCSIDHDLSEHQMKSTWPGCQCVPFNVPYKRPVKPKVKRRQEVKALSILDTVYPPDVKFFMEWEE